jgi:hypothetical protein
MTDSMCPSLRRLGSLLKTAYRLRDNRLASKDGTGLAKAERDLFRVHRLIVQHRSFCRFCLFNETLEDVPTRYNDPHSNVIPIDRVN